MKTKIAFALFIFSSGALADQNQDALSFSAFTWHRQFLSEVVGEHCRKLDKYIQQHTDAVLTDIAIDSASLCAAWAASNGVLSKTRSQINSGEINRENYHSLLSPEHLNELTSQGMMEMLKQSLPAKP